MAIILRTEKGSALTWTELDGNFTELSQSINTVTASWALNAITASYTLNGGTIVGAGTQNYLAFFSGSAVAIGSSVVYQNGSNIGIGGITNPNAILHVSSSFRVTGGNGRGQLTVDANDSVQVGPTSGNTGNAIFRVYGGTSNGASTIDLGYNNTYAASIGVNNPGELIINPVSRSVFMIGGTEVARINSSGSLLIGTTVGNYKLRVSGSEISGSLNVDNVLVVSGSNIGIGTTTPTAKLTVVGSTDLTGSVAISGPTTISGSFTVVSGSTEFQVLGTGTKMGNAHTDVHSITGSLTTSGSVGINTTASSNWNLDIAGSTTGKFRIGNINFTDIFTVGVGSGDQGYSDMYLNGQTYTVALYANPQASEGYTVNGITYSTASVGLVAGGNSAPLVLGTNNTEKMRVHLTGDVSIGTQADNKTLPGYRLNITGSGVAGSLNVNRVLVVSGSNVGISTTAPSYSLDVRGTGRFTSALWLDAYNGNSSLSFIRPTDGAQVTALSMNTGIIKVGGGNINFVDVYTADEFTARFGSYTANNTHALKTAGGIFASGSSSTSTGIDYFFKVSGSGASGAMNINNVLYVSGSSVQVSGSTTISDVLVLPFQSPLPANKPIGSVAISGSGGTFVGMFVYNGTSWINVKT